MRSILTLAAGLLLLAACGDTPTPNRAVDTLEIVAESTRQWTGVAVSPEGRIFVNFPRWSDDVPVSVAEIVDGKPVAFPDARWNEWQPGAAPDKHFVCVQSVVFDDQGRLWVLDPANPGFGGVVAGGPKLMAFDIETREVTQTIRFAAPVVEPGSYLNDVRFDTQTNTAYITDSGDGALVVVDLDAGSARRVLARHSSTMAEPIEITIEGKAWKRDGKTPQVHADGIALSPNRRFIYYQVLTGRTMYRIATEALRDSSLDAEELAARVERIVESGVSDGLLFHSTGLYLSSLEEDAINRLERGVNKRQRVVGDPRIAWPDSFSSGPDGWIYFTTAQIHRGPSPADPYRIWRFKP
jgi:sugar lactone lactonase YvrE